MASDMVKDHSDSERGNLLPTHGKLFQLAAWVLLYAPFHRQANTTAFVKFRRGALGGTRNSSMGPLREGMFYLKANSTLNE